MSTYHASCHCGAVSYDIDMALEDLMTCNCSICGRTGAIMAFVPKAAIQNLAGEDKLTDYQFGSKSIHHAFCSVCGARPLAWGKGAEGQEFAMINVRCLEGVDPHQVAITTTYDGKSR